MTDEKTTVLEHSAIGEGYRLLQLSAPETASAVQPGQFVHVRVPALEPSALRRPFSVFDADAERGTISVLYKTVGRGTAALNTAAPGERIMVEGPLGRGFPLDVRGAALLVGGGYGVAPLHFLAKRLLAGPAASACRPILFAGGRTASDLLAIDRFERLGVETRLATNDGSVGAKGFVTVPLDAALAELREKGADFSLCACGPDGLLEAVARRACELGAPGWISMDRHMVCGVGACFACIQQTVRGNARCCIDGPVFAAADLVWPAPPQQAQALHR